jgi:hypothetical protein
MTQLYAQVTKGPEERPLNKRERIDQAATAAADARVG